MDKDEARARLIALAETTPKGVQRDALVMGANALINDIANQWLKEHDAEVRAKAIEEYKEKSFDAIGIILSKTHLELNTQLTIYAKIMNEMNKIEEELKEQKNDY